MMLYSTNSNTVHVLARACATPKRAIISAAPPSPPVGARVLAGALHPQAALKWSTSKLQE